MLAGVANSTAARLSNGVHRLRLTCEELARALVAHLRARKRHSLLTAAACLLLMGAYLVHGALAQPDSPAMLPAEELAKLPGRPEDPATGKLMPIAADT